jgi:multicomponent Na+:H+ antiporter subunit D
LGGIYRSYPFISILFIISAFSLAGMPPLSGFWSKLLLIKAGLELKSYVLVLVALLVSLLTLFSMTKIWDQVFWKVSPVAEDSEQMDGRLCHGVVDGFFLFMPLLIPVVLILSIGFFTEIYLEVMGRAARQLLNPAEYIQSVLGGRP